MKQIIPYIDPTEKQKQHYMKRQKADGIIGSLLTLLLLIGFFYFLWYQRPSFLGTTWVFWIFICLEGVAISASVMMLCAAIKEPLTFSDVDCMKLRNSLTYKRYYKDQLRFVIKNKKFWTIQLANVIHIANKIVQFLWSLILMSVGYLVMGSFLYSLFLESPFDLTSHAASEGIRAIGMMFLTLSSLVSIGYSLFVGIKSMLKEDFFYQLKTSNLFQFLKLWTVLIIVLVVTEEQNLSSLETINPWPYAVGFGLVYFFLKVLHAVMMKRLRLRITGTKKNEVVLNEEGTPLFLQKNGVLPEFEYEETDYYNAIKPLPDWEEFVDVLDVNRTQLLGIPIPKELYASDGLILSNKKIQTALTISYNLKYSPIRFGVNWTDDYHYGINLKGMPFKTEDMQGIRLITEPLQEEKSVAQTKDTGEEETDHDG